LDRIVTAVVADLLARWQRPDGSFRSRQLLVGWDNVPMHRWAQAQVFRSLCFFFSRIKGPRNRSAADTLQRLPLKIAN
jgi:hypothetical protein